MITVSVPGKIHLMGEHVVVYGKPALITGINRRLIARVEKSGQGIHVDTNEPSEYVERIVSVAANLLNIPEAERDVSISITSDIKPGYHLGSSAAVAVAVSGALMYFWKKIWNPIEINKIAYEAEKLQHGNPSGGDNTAVTFGGLVWYRKELEFLKSMWNLPVHIPAQLNHFYLIDTGRPEESTGHMVAYVKKRYERNPSGYDRLFGINELQTKMIANAIKQNNEAELMSGIKNGERTLEKMGVVSTTAKKIIVGIEMAEGVAKILGGGGRQGAVGYILSYLPDYAKAAYVSSPGALPLEPINLGEEGIRLESRGEGSA